MFSQLYNNIANSATSVPAYLHAGLCEADPHGELLPHEDVRVVGLAEAPLQLVQLAGRKPGSVPLLTT